MKDIWPKSDFHFLYFRAKAVIENRSKNETLSCERNVRWLVCSMTAHSFTGMQRYYKILLSGCHPLFKGAEHQNRKFWYKNRLLTSVSFNQITDARAHRDVTIKLSGQQVITRAFYEKMKVKKWTYKTDITWMWCILMEIKVNETYLKSFFIFTC